MTIGMLCAILFFDLLLGDPHGWPHPIVWIGQLITRLETWLRKKIKQARFAGILLLLQTLLISGVSAALLLRIADTLSGFIAWLVSLWLGWSCLALRSLHQESRVVIAELEAGNIVGARQALAMIVGRETADLDEEEILRACIETVAENTSDGVVAPIFYLVIGGPVLGLIFKAASTLDSMVGYKNERYREFGWASARFDDLLNWIPARLTGLLLVAAAHVMQLNGNGAMSVMLRDARKHASPNAGWPEAAAAGALGIQLGGPATYFGEKIDKPTFGNADQVVGVKHYRQMIKLLYLSAFGAFLFGLIVLGVMR